MSKPVQVAVAYQRDIACEQYGSYILLVLCEDGKIYERMAIEGSSTMWNEVNGPWKPTPGQFDTEAA